MKANPRRRRDWLIARRFGFYDVDEFLEQFTPEEYRELLASERLDPDPMARLCEIMKIGFATIVSGLGGEEITPEMFDPMSSELNSKPVILSPNAMARAVGAIIPMQQ